MSFFLIWASIVSGRLSFGPELENSDLPLTGSTNLPLISPLDLLKSMLFTLPSSTAVVNCEYVRSAFEEPLPARLLTMNAAAISARTIQGTQRNDGELPPDGGVGRRARRTCVGPPRRRGSGRVTVGPVRRAVGLRLAGIGFDPGFEVGLAAA